MLKCDYRRHDSFASAQTGPVLQKRRHAPSSSVEMVTTRRTVLENELSELPEGEPRLSAVSEPSLYVVYFVHIILSLSRVEMFQNLLLPLQSPPTQHLRVFDIRDP